MLLYSTLLDIRETMTPDGFIRLVIEWNQSSSYTENIISGIEWNGERNIRYGRDGLWLDIEEYRNENIIAVRFEKSEKNGAVWDTDYVMNFDSMQMSVRLDRSYTADALDNDKEFSTPHFISLLIEKDYLKDDCQLPVLSSAIVINAENADLLAGIINGKMEFKLPVVYVSKTHNNTAPLNVVTLAKNLKGVAHVMLEEGISLNRIIRDKCERKNERYGEIGIYYPPQGNDHRRYRYRSAVGYEEYLLKQVVRDVIQYSNVQMMDPLFSWEGVNSAILKDKFTSQYEKTIEAKKDNDAFLAEYEKDMKEWKDKLEALTRENEKLRNENQGLKTKLDSSKTKQSVLCMGEEMEFYTGEIKDLLLRTLDEAVKNMPESRRADVVNDIIEHNDYQKLGEKREEEIDQILKDYNGMTPRCRRTLEDLGFKITDEGKHYKVTYCGDGRYHMTYSKTPSDGRTGKNIAKETIKLCF